MVKKDCADPLQRVKKGENSYKKQVYLDLAALQRNSDESWDLVENSDNEYQLAASKMANKLSTISSACTRRMSGSPGRRHSGRK